MEGNGHVNEATVIQATAILRPHIGPVINEEEKDKEMQREKERSKEDHETGQQCFELPASLVRGMLKKQHSEG